MDVIIDKIYCLPGTMCDQRLWQALSKEIGNKVELIHVAIPMGSSIDEMVQQLAQILPEEKFSLLGFSLGGYLASAFASQFPERLKQLIVLANSPVPLPKEEVATRQKIIHWINAQGYSGITLSRIKAFLHVDHHQDETTLTLIKQMDTSLGEQVLLQQLSAASIRVNLLPAFKNFNFPVFFGFGEHDHLVCEDRIKQCAKACSHIHYQIFEKCGHMLPLEQPRRLAQSILHFIH